MSEHHLTDEEADWLRDLLGTSNIPAEGNLSQLVMPDGIRDTLLEKRFVRQREDWLEVTGDGIDAIWQYVARRAQRA